MVSAPPEPAPEIKPEAPAQGDKESPALSDKTELSDFIEAAGLLSYDPAAITRIYAGHPQRLIRRLWQTLVPIGLYLLGVWFDWFTGLLKGPGDNFR